jgi:hypothetical protein
MSRLVRFTLLILVFALGCAGQVAQSEPQVFSEEQNVYHAEWRAICAEFQVPGVKATKLGPKLERMNLSEATKGILKNLDDICLVPRAVKKLSGRDWFCENPVLPMDKCAP